MKYLLIVISVLLFNSCAQTNCKICKTTIPEPSKEELAKFKGIK